MIALFKRQSARSKTIPYTTNRKLGPVRTAKESRTIYKGFPCEKPFASKREVDEYLGRDTITCLRCGGEFKALVNHIWVHEGWNVRRYKEYYSIPKGRGLVCLPTHEKLLAQERDYGQLFKKGHVPPMCTGTLPKYRRDELTDNARLGYGMHWKGYDRIRLMIDLITFGCTVKETAGFLKTTEKGVRSSLYRNNVRLR